MAISFVQFKSVAFSPTYVNISPTAGNALVLAGALSSAFPGTPTAFNCMSAINGGGSVLASFTIPASMSNTNYGAANLQVVGAYLLSLPAGIASITETWSSGTPGYGFIAVSEFSGVDHSSGFVTGTRNGVNTPGTGANAISSGSATVSSAATYLTGICIDNNQNNNMTAGTGYTALAAAANGCLAAGQAISSSGSYAATFTDATHGAADGYGALLFALAPVGAGAGIVDEDYFQPPQGENATLISRRDVPRRRRWRRLAGSGPLVP